MKSIIPLTLQKSCPSSKPFLIHRRLAILSIWNPDLRMLEGNTVILIDGSSRGIIASSIGGEERGVEEPQSQTVVRGPKEGFTEISVRIQP